MLQRVAHYEIKKEIGHGGMGVAYLAENIHLKRECVVKAISDKYAHSQTFKEQFLQEAQRQAEIDHPNIVRVIDFLIEHGRCFLVMEYIDGEDLSDLLEQKGPFVEKEALEILEGILTGIGYAHQKGVVHRDIKPSNIMISRIENKWHAQIMDFGLAAKIGGKAQTIKASTPGYASPEQISSSSDKIDKISDIYSIGIVLFKMLTGRLPFDGEPDEIKTKQKEESPPDITAICPHVSKRTANAVARCLKKDPGDRFQDCDEFLKYLEPGGTPIWPLIAGFISVLAIVFFVLSFPTWKQDKLPPPLEVEPIPPPSLVLKPLVKYWENDTRDICKNYKKIDVGQHTLEVIEEISGSGKTLRKVRKDIKNGKERNIDLIAKLIAEFDKTLKGHGRDEVMSGLKNVNFENQGSYDQFLKFTNREWRSKINYENFRANVNVCSKIKQ